MFSRPPYLLSWSSLLAWHPPGFYVIAMAVLMILFVLVGLGNAIIGLRGNLRDFRDGR